MQHIHMQNSRTHSCSSDAPPPPPHSKKKMKRRGAWQETDERGWGGTAGWRHRGERGRGGCVRRRRRGGGCLGRDNLRRWEQTLASPRWEQDERSRSRTGEPDHQNKGSVRLSECFGETFSPRWWVFMTFQTGCFMVGQSTDAVGGSHRTHLAGRQDKMGALMGSPPNLNVWFRSFKKSAAVYAKLFIGWRRKDCKRLSALL